MRPMCRDIPGKPHLHKEGLFAFCVGNCKNYKRPVGKIFANGRKVGKCCRQKAQSGENNLSVCEVYGLVWNFVGSHFSLDIPSPCM